MVDYTYLSLEEGGSATEVLNIYLLSANPWEENQEGGWGEDKCLGGLLSVFLSWGCCPWEAACVVELLFGLQHVLG